MSDKQNQVDYDKWIIYANGDTYPSQAKEVTVELHPGIYNVLRNPTNLEKYLVQQKFEVDELIDLDTKESKVVENEVKRFWNSKEEYDKNLFLHKRGILMVGAPGTGKTSIINMSLKWFIEEKKGIVISASSGDDLSHYSQFHKKIRAVEPDRPMMVIFEDIDGYVDNRDTYYLSTLLNILDGNNQINNVMYIATTNFPEKLPDSLVNRPGRFDLKVEVKMPSDREKMMYITNKLGKLTADQEKEWLFHTENMNMSFISEMIKQHLIYKLPLSEIKENIELYKSVAKSSSSFEKEEGPIGFKSKMSDKARKEFEEA